MVQEVAHLGYDERGMHRRSKDAGAPRRALQRRPTISRMEIAPVLIGREALPPPLVAAACTSNRASIGRASR
jgi:hypothetical protein